MFEIRTDDPGFSSFPCAIVDLTTRRVCAECNHGWMSDLESVVSPLLAPAVLGDTATLPARSHLGITRWAVKTAMVIDCVWGDKGAERIVPDHHCRKFYETQTPRNATFVWTITVGYDPRTQSFRDGVLARTHVGVERFSNGSRADGYAITWHFGYFGVQVVCFGVDDDGLNTASRAPLQLPDGQVLPADAFTRQLWPPKDDAIAWPPPVGLEQVGFGVFTVQPPFIS